MSPRADIIEKLLVFYRLQKQAARAHDDAKIAVHQARGDKGV